MLENDRYQTHYDMHMFIHYPCKTAVAEHGMGPSCLHFSSRHLAQNNSLLAVLGTFDMSLMHGMKQAPIKCEHTVRAGAVILALPHFRCFGLPMLMLFTVVLSVLFAK